MNCATHANHCAYTGTEPDLCGTCHASIAKITQPATYQTAAGVRFTGGYGETRTEHEQRHATNARRKATR